MSIRRRCLPGGWYPHTGTDTIRRIETMQSAIAPRPAPGSAGIVPHAGWDFSGKAALNVILSLEGPVDTCVVVGGHLPAGAGILAASEEAYETPLGPLPVDRDLWHGLCASMSVSEDISPDNTVEIQLPFVKYAHPDVHLLWLRAAPSPEAVRLGEALHSLARESGKRLLVLGSTDLTHYGPDYGFTAHGRGDQAVRWVKEVNDKKFLDAILTFDLSGALAAAEEDSSACSAGGAVAAAAYARARGSRAGTLLSHDTSYDLFPHASFVGYAGIVYRD